jgi:hypothetical protein
MSTRIVFRVKGTLMVGVSGVGVGEVLLVVVNGGNSMGIVVGMPKFATTGRKV